jgi:hypothetical protein
LKYEPAKVEAYYDAYGEKEWERLIKDPAGLVSFHIHQLLLKKYVKSNVASSLQLDIINLNMLATETSDFEILLLTSY